MIDSASSRGRGGQWHRADLLYVVYPLLGSATAMSFAALAVSIGTGAPVAVTWSVVALGALCTVALALRLGRCGVSIRGSRCTVVSVWGTETYQLDGARSVVWRPTPAGKVTLAPAIRPDGHPPVTLHVMSGASEGRLWDLVMALEEARSGLVTGESDAGRRD